MTILINFINSDFILFQNSKGDLKPENILLVDNTNFPQVFINYSLKFQANIIIIV